MIKICVNRNEFIESITITGHAMYDDYGKDIVCSAVSTCVITTINGISELNDKYLLVEESKDKLIIKIEKRDIVCDKLINNMLNMLEELSIQYPKNIKLK